MWDLIVSVPDHCLCFYLWPSAGKGMSLWLFTCVVFIFREDLVVRFPFPFGVLGRMWNSILSVPDHCLFIYFTRYIARMYFSQEGSLVSASNCVRK